MWAKSLCFPLDGSVASKKYVWRLESGETQAFQRDFCGAACRYYNVNKGVAWCTSKCVWILPQNLEMQTQWSAHFSCAAEESTMAGRYWDELLIAFRKTELHYISSISFRCSYLDLSIFQLAIDIVESSAQAQLSFSLGQVVYPAFPTGYVVIY